jgi:glutaredoxin
MFRFRPSKREPLQVTLYSKPGCHLCEDARALLESMAPRHPLRIEEVDIRSDPGLFRKYDIRIPVIAFADGTELEAPIHGTQLRAALKAMNRRG